MEQLPYPDSIWIANFGNDMTILHAILVSIFGFVAPLIAFTTVLSDICIKLGKTYANKSYNRMLRLNGGVSNFIRGNF